MSREIELIAPDTGSGTSEYGVDSEGRLYSRGYGETHGRTFGGADCVVYHHTAWGLACEEQHDWRALVAEGVSLHAYLRDRERGLSHAEAYRRELSRQLAEIRYERDVLRAALRAVQVAS